MAFYAFDAYNKKIDEYNNNYYFCVGALITF